MSHQTFLCRKSQRWLQCQWLLLSRVPGDGSTIGVTEHLRPPFWRCERKGSDTSHTEPVHIRHPRRVKKSNQIKRCVTLDRTRDDVFGGGVLRTTPGLGPAQETGPLCAHKTSRTKIRGKKTKQEQSIQTGFVIDRVY